MDSLHPFDRVELPVLAMAGAMAFCGAAFGSTLDRGGCGLEVWTTVGGESKE